MHLKAPGFSGNGGAGSWSSGVIGSFIEVSATDAWNPASSDRSVSVSELASFS